MINALKGATPDFFTVSSLRRELSPTRSLKWPWRNRVHITCRISSAYHVQHVMMTMMMMTMIMMMMMIIIILSIRDVASADAASSRHEGTAGGSVCNMYGSWA